MSLPPLHQQGWAALEFRGSLSGYTGRVLLNRARTYAEERVAGQDNSPVFGERIKTVSDALSAAESEAHSPAAKATR
ncbi:MAG: hypothetical protein NVSMB2_19130 [Chloroflexota bacterium]